MYIRTDKYILPKLYGTLVCSIKCMVYILYTAAVITKMKSELKLYLMRK